MVSLRGHATDRPARWKEPRAFAAADHTSPRARQRRGRLDSVDVSAGSVADRAGGGKSDPSRAPDTRAGDPDDRGAPPDCADGAGARPGPRPHARRCDRPTRNTRGPRSHDGQIANRRWQRRQVFWRSGVSMASEHRALRLDIPPKPWHNGRTGPDVGARGGHGGPEVQSGPSPSVRSAYASALRATSPAAVDAAASVDAQTRPQAAWKTAQTAVFHTAHRPSCC